MNHPVQTVRVGLGDRAYPIEIAHGNLEQVAQSLGALRPISQAIVITDEVVAPLYADRVAKLLRQAGIQTTVLSVPAGEASKSIQSAEQLWQQILAAGADRKTVVVAVGGGVVGDLAGFVAATFARGIDLFQIPTTLLAQVDSSVGGKVGINLPDAKNMVGAFWQPAAVLIDTQVLATLPEREFQAGLAEVIKYGVILDAEFFAWLESQGAALLERHPAVLNHMVARCCRLKADVVEQDEREETGLRAVLNYGHTFCHAIEAATGYGQFLHGEAVAIGMLCASRLAERLGRIDASLTQRQHALLTAVGLPTQVPDVDHRRLVDLMAHDKKVEHGRLRFVLPSRLGHVELVGGVAEADVLAALGEGTT